MAVQKKPPGWRAAAGKAGGDIFPILRLVEGVGHPVAGNLAAQGIVRYPDRHRDQFHESFKLLQAAVQLLDDLREQSRPAIPFLYLVPATVREPALPERPVGNFPQHRPQTAQVVQQNEIVGSRGERFNDCFLARAFADVDKGNVAICCTGCLQGSCPGKIGHLP